jgi:hypothetical protein
MKYIILKGNFVFDLHDVSQEHEPGIKRDLLVLGANVLADKQWNGSSKYSLVLSFRTKLVNLKC